MAGAAHDPARRHFEALLHAGTTRDAPDARLLAAFVDGGPAASAAFAALVERHGPMALRACRRILGDPHDAEDAAQAAFLVLARRARAIRRRESVACWLLGVAYRIARRARRAAARRRKHERRAAEMVSRRTAGDGPGPDRPWADFYAELERLPEGLREPLVLCDLEGLTHEQAASRLGTPLRTVQRRLAAGRGRLRAGLIRRGVAPAVVAGAGLAAARGAELRDAWAESTVRAAVGLATGRGAAGVASAAALAMEEGAMKAMTRTKLMTSAALAAIGLSAALATGLAAARSGREPRAAQAEVAPRQEAPRRAYRGTLPDVAGWHLLDLRVVDEATGEPLPDAEVLVLEYVDLEFHAFPTGPDGRLRVEFPSINEPMAALEIRKDGYIPIRRGLGGPDGPIPETLSVGLRRGESIGGTVVDEAGEPIAGATVVVTVSGYGEGTGVEGRRPDESVYEVPTTTDAAGRWVFGGIPPLAKAVSLQLIHPDYISDGCTTLAQVPASRRSLPIGPLRAKADRQVMRKGALVHGRVLDEQGRPVPGARVVEASRGLTFLTYIRHALADEEGRFRFHFDPGEDVVLTVQAAGRVPGERSFRVPPEGEEIEFGLGPGRTIRGRVVDQAGNPVGGVMVFIPSGARHQGLFLRTWTDSEGRFRWDGAPEEPVSLSFSGGGYLDIPGISLGPSDKDAEIRLRPALDLKDKVHDAETGEAVAGFTVTPGVVDPGTGEVRWNPGEARTTREPEFRLSLDGTVPEHRFRVEADGYETFVSRTLKGSEGDVSYDVGLHRPAGRGPSGRVRQPDGNPLAGAEVVAGGGWLKAGRIAEPRGRVIVRTDAEGRFALPPLEKPYPLVVASDAGFAELEEGPESGELPEITVRPWGRIEGRLLIGPRPAPGRKVELILDRMRSSVERGLSLESEAESDAEGRFAFDRVPPSRDLRIFHDLGAGPDVEARSYGVLVAVEPGETARVTIGGAGRPVVGRLLPPEQDGQVRRDYLSRVQVELESDRPRIPYPDELRKARDERMSRWGRDWWYSEEGRAYRGAWISRSYVATRSDGTFRFEDIPPGSYRLRVTADPRPPGVTRRAEEPAAVARRPFVVAEIPGGRSDEPIDLGPLRLSLPKSLRAGEPAPPFEARTLDGRPMRLEDYRGKYVLLDFWATWCGPCLAELPEMEAVHRRFGDDARFAMISLSLDAEIDEPRQFVEARGLGWVQGFLGDWSATPVPEAYHVEGIPSIFLIGPDGRLLATGLRGAAIGAEVSRALGGE